MAVALKALSHEWAGGAACRNMSSHNLLSETFALLPHLLVGLVVSGANKSNLGFGGLDDGSFVRVTRSRARRE